MLNFQQEAVLGGDMLQEVPRYNPLVSLYASSSTARSISAEKKFRKGSKYTAVPFSDAIHFP